MRALFAIATLFAASAAAAVPPLVLYDDALQNGFGDASWASSGDYSLSSTTLTFNGSSHAIRFVARNWGGLQFVANGEFNFADYQSLSLHVNGGASGGQQLQVYVCDNYGNVDSVRPLGSLIAGGNVPVNAWSTATLDFGSAGLTFGTFNCLVIMDANGNNDAAGQPALYIDQIVFNPRAGALPSGAAVAVSVDESADVHPVSPLIFGVAFGDATRNQQMRYTVDRWGGNSVTRYNWRGPAHNAASDYFYLGYGTDQTDDADTFVTNALAGGQQPLIAVPTIGWVEKFSTGNPTQVVWGFSQAKYGPQTLDECRFYNPNPPPWCHGDAGNGYCDASNTTGFCVAGQIVGNDPADTSSANAPSDDAAWVAHLQGRFGNAGAGGVTYYSLDNEVMLWNSTHRDVHPVAPTYAEIWNKTQAYAAAIKAQDPNAVVTGPVTWGYCDLFGSAADNCLDGSDRQAHGGTPFVAWYLQQVCANPLAGGKHLVDYLDLHYYPQDPNGASGSIYSNNDDSATRARRLASLRELYDSGWTSQSWIGTLGNDPTYHYTNPNLIPRVKAWINQYCPGTKLAITEYAWDQDATPDGAVAQAEALAIFAREGVDMATRWTAPGANTRAERGFSIFLNYDGAGSQVQGDSVRATSSAIDQVGAYAFHGNQRTFVLLTNKDAVTHDANLSFNSQHVASWTLYGFTGASNVAQTGSGSINGSAMTVSALPPMSASLLVIPDADEIFKDGFGG